MDKKDKQAARKSRDITTQLEEENLYCISASRVSWFNVSLIHVSAVIAASLDNVEPVNVGSDRTAMTHSKPPTMASISAVIIEKQRNPVII